MRIPDILNNRLVQTVGVGVVTFAGGAGVGYILGQRKTTKDAMQVFDEMLAELQDGSMFVPRGHFLVKEEDVYEELPVEDDDLHDIQESANAAAAAIKDYRAAFTNRQYPMKTSPLEDPKPEPETDDPVDEADYEESEVPEDIPEKRNIFDNDDSWNYEEEQQKRTGSSGPFVIHQDEYMEDEMGYTQSTLTYYTGDNILSDEQDVPVYQHERITGPLLFGHGSNDRNVVYIRNEELRAEYEILRFEGFFEREVLGYQIEQEAEKSLAHGVMKFRED